MPSNLRQHDLTPTWVSIDELSPLGHASRKHPSSQIDKLARNLETFGFVAPILVDDQHRVVDGWALVLAARRLLLSQVPVVRLTGLTEAQIRTLRLALNRLSEESRWDTTELRLEFASLLELDSDLDLTLTGFEMGEIDHLLIDTDPIEPPIEPPDRSTPAITQPGDLWLLGDHRLLCGDALNPADYTTLLGEVRAVAVFTDPPYNVPIQGHVSGKGKIIHAEFSMASGEMTPAEFLAFLNGFISQLVAFSHPGSIHFLCMDWRHLHTLLDAGLTHYTEFKNLCVWNKTNAGMGSFYRSKHELIAVFKHGTAAHINNIELGRYGRHRTNVWDYAGANTFRTGRMDDLAAHPTVKPLDLVADALLDTTHRGDTVLDPFLGSGTTLLACEQTGRVGYGLELDAHYVDVAVRRWQALSGCDARLQRTNETLTARTQAALQNNNIPEVDDE